jgi:protein-S-isoprenylcysteine O-methyltransferase Ste14
VKRLAVALPARPRATGQALGFELVENPEQARAASGLDVERLSDLVARAIVVVLFSTMAIRFGADFLATGRITGLMLLVSEVLVVALTVMRRSAATVDRSMRARVLTALSMLGPPLLQPGRLTAFAPEAVTVAMSVAGLAVVIAGKVTLGRSFGLMPANRGIVSTGVYRLVRHPIYTGYLVTHVAFLVANPGAWNILALLAADAALLARAVCEEATLSRDARYREYQQKVRWRVLPGVF